MTLTLAALGAVSLTRALQFRYDFHHFYLDAEYVWRHAELNPQIEHNDAEQRRQLPFYLPGIAVLLAPLAMGGRVPAAVVWTLGQIGAAGVCLWLAYRACEPEQDREQAWRRWVLVWLLSLAPLYEAARFNQLSFLVLALVWGGARWISHADARTRHTEMSRRDADVRRLHDRNSLVGGALIGVAAGVKLLPAILLPWLLLRRPRAAIAMLLAAALVAVGPSLLAFGPQRTLTYLTQWAEHNLGAARGMLDPALREHFIDHRNQSLGDVLARLTAEDHPYRVPWQPLTWSDDVRRRVVLGAQIALLAGLIGVTVYSGTGGSAHAFTLFALWCLAMLLFSPLLRQYYLIWAMPALVALVRHQRGARMLARIAVLLWVAGLAAWLSETARASGVHLWILLALAAVLFIFLAIGGRAAATRGALDGPSRN